MRRGRAFGELLRLGVVLGARRNVAGSANPNALPTGFQRGNDVVVKAIADEDALLGGDFAECFGAAEDGEVWLALAHFAFDEDGAETVFDPERTDLLTLHIGGAVRDEAEQIASRQFIQDCQRIREELEVGVSLELVRIGERFCQRLVFDAHPCKGAAHQLGAAGLAALQVALIPTGALDVGAVIAEGARPLADHFIGRVPGRAMLLERVLKPNLGRVPIAAQGVVKVEEDDLDRGEIGSVHAAAILL